MLDRRLRAAKDRWIAPLVRVVPARVAPAWLTALSLAGGVAAGVLAAGGARWGSVAVWLASRLLDGLDGAVARARGRASDLGGYLDQLADTVAYAAVPLGVAAAEGSAGVWAWCAVLLGTFYVNIVSWAYLSAIAEKRQAGAGATGERTTIHMPAGLVEGAESVVLLALVLAFPDAARGWFVVMAAAVAFTVAQRVHWAVGALR